MIKFFAQVVVEEAADALRGFARRRWDRRSLAKECYERSGQLRKIRTLQRYYSLRQAENGEMTMPFAGWRWGNNRLASYLFSLSMQLDWDHWDHWALVHDDCDASICDVCGGMICDNIVCDDIDANF